MIRFEDIQEVVEKRRPDADIEVLRRAYVYSAKAHQGQVRQSGEPYLIHPLAVAYILADLDLDVATVATGLLHDVVEDSHVTMEEIESVFGVEVASLVDGVTKLSRLEISSEADRQAESIRKMILAMVNDIRVILVKLADRLHNMRTLQHLKPEKQKRIANETMEIYVPLANRLGLGRMRHELEDLSLRYSEPRAYQRLVDQLEKKRPAWEKFVEELKARLAPRLEEGGAKVEIHGRVKSIYSIHHKMKVQDIDLDQVYDLVAIRIITETVRDCYGALGIVHSLWPPVPGRFKDFIAMPKPNLYQSVHTTVMSERGHPFEVQIRTHEMHHLAEEGIAAHWRYKEQGMLTDREVAGLKWLRQVMEWQKDIRDSKEFLKYVKVDLFPEEVYVFTPAGKVIGLPRGATPVDFAYSVHTEVGHQCSGARVNGKLVPLKTPLANGDMVEIITHSGHHPSRDWLSFTKTSKARSKIRAFLKVQDQRRSVELGRSLLEREMRRFGTAIKNVSEEERSAALRVLHVESMDDLHAKIGHGRITPKEFITELLPSETIEQEEAPSILRRVTRALQRGSGKISVQGMGDTLITMAGCCNPIPGDGIVGYITRGRGVSVHAAECKNLENLLINPERRIEVAWSRTDSSDRFQIGLRVMTEHRPGMLARIAEILEKEKSNIRHADIGVDEQGRGLILIVCEVADRRQAQRLVSRARRTEGVFSVERISPLLVPGMKPS